MRKSLVLAALVTLAACGTEPPDPATASIAGTWQLRTMQGQPLPFVLPVVNPGVTTSLTRYTITIAASGGWRSQYVEVSVRNGMAPHTDTVDEYGEWRRMGPTVTFFVGSPLLKKATFDGVSLIMNIGGEMIFTR